MELTSADWINASLTEALLAREGPPLYVAARPGCVAAVRMLTGLTAVDAAQLPGTLRVLQELILPGQGEG